MADERIRLELEQRCPLSIAESPRCDLIQRKSNFPQRKIVAWDSVLRCNILRSDEPLEPLRDPPARIPRSGNHPHSLSGTFDFRLNGAEAMGSPLQIHLEFKMRLSFRRQSRPNSGRTRCT